MAKVSTFLNFPGNTEEAFTLYKKVFGTEFQGEVVRLGDAAGKANSNMVAHIALPILGGHVLQGADVPESTGLKIAFGNNIYITLEPNTRPETDALFKGLSEGGKVQETLKEQPWGAYYGICTDKFGVQWVFSCVSKT